MLSSGQPTLRDVNKLGQVPRLMTRARKQTPVGDDQKNWCIQIERNRKSGTCPMAKFCCGDKAVALFSRGLEGRLRASG